MGIEQANTDIVKLTKITNIGRTGNFDVGQSEVLICSWNNRANPELISVLDTNKLFIKATPYFISVNQ
ncbi:MAG: hypothetical protein JWN83_2259 [Chitinophagaceae bacterium]|nr:hypothetical protein [Chitinophagaceae bacterium]